MSTLPELLNLDKSDHVSEGTDTNSPLVSLYVRPNYRTKLRKRKTVLEVIWNRSLLPFLRLLESSQLGSLMVFSAALALVGTKITENCQGIRRVSSVLAASTFVALLDILWQRSLPFVVAIDELAVRALLGGAAVYGLTCILAIPATAIYQATIMAGFRHLRRYAEEIARAQKKRHDEREKALERSRRSETLAREKALAEAQASANAAAQRRRENARTSCELLFMRNAPELDARFTRQMFDDFVARHLSDGFPPEYVEQRAEELKSLIRLHLAKANPRRKNLAELAQWFLDEKQQIQEAAIADDDKQLLLAQLEERCVRLQEEYLRGVRP